MFKKKEVNPAQGVVRLWEEEHPGPHWPRMCLGSREGSAGWKQPGPTRHMGTGSETSVVKTTGFEFP